MSVPVTIVATDASEKAGDPVTVQFAFSFNGNSVLYDNGTADFAYSASYTYMGQTKLLASSDVKLGEGFTPTGSGQSNTATGTLHAYIGDTPSDSGLGLTTMSSLAADARSEKMGSGFQPDRMRASSTTDL